MIVVPSVTKVALLLGLSLFLGLAFEDFFARTDTKRPGGIRTFPMLAFAGGVLYLFDPEHFVPFTGGLLVLGAWLTIYYRRHLREASEGAEPNVGLVVPVLNVQAYLLGPVTLALPPWVAVTMTVTSVLLLTGREKLHALARRIELGEIVTAGEFLILTGIVLPLLPSEPVTTLTSITPRQAWLALVVVCSLSYASYLAQRYWTAAAHGLWMAALGGLYSSTAETVVLARQAATGAVMRRQAQAGITLATAIMYMRILAVVAFFNLTLAREVAPALCVLSLAGLGICGVAILAARLGRAPQAGRNDIADDHAAAVRRQPFGAWAGGAVRDPVHHRVPGDQMGHHDVRHVRHLFAGGHRRRDRYRSLRAQSGPGWHAERAEQRACGRDPDRRFFQQHSQGGLRGLFRDARDRGQRCRTGVAGRCGRRHRAADERALGRAGAAQRMVWSL